MPPLAPTMDTSVSSNNNNNNNRIPSNSVIVADIGLHTIKSGFTLGHRNIGYDDSNVQNNSSSSTSAAAKLNPVFGNINESSASVSMRSSVGLDLEYRVTDADAIVESALSALPSFSSWRRKLDIANDNTNNEDAATSSSNNGFILNRETRFDDIKNELPGCVALLLPYGIRRGCVEKILEALFEGPAPPRAFLGCSSLQALHAVGVTSGTVVDVGQFETRILPSTDGSCHRSFAVRNKNIGAAYQGLASVCSLLKNSNNNNNDQNEATLNAISEHFLSKSYMKFLTPRTSSPLDAISSVGEFSDDLVRIFDLGCSSLGLAWMHYPLSTSAAVHRKINSAHFASTLPDGNKIEFHHRRPKINNSINNNNNQDGDDANNNNNNTSKSSSLIKYYFPLKSVLHLQDSYIDYLFDPASFRTSLLHAGSSTPLFTALSETLMHHHQNGGGGFVPPTSIIDSLRHMFRTIAVENSGNHDSTMFRSAASNIVLTGGGSVHSGVETHFTYTVESDKFAKSCLVGGPVIQGGGERSNQQQYDFYAASENAAAAAKKKKDGNKSSNDNNNNNRDQDNNNKVSACGFRPTSKILHNRLNGPWVGGALFTQLSSLSDVTVSSSTFAQEGPSACAHVYGVGGWRS